MAEDSVPSPRSRDPQSDLLRESRGLGRAASAARDAWVAGLPEDGIRRLFAFEMHLKALTRLADPRVHPGPRGSAGAAAGGDWSAALVVVRATLLQARSLARPLVDPFAAAWAPRRAPSTLLPEDPHRRPAEPDDDASPMTAARSLQTLDSALACCIEMVDAALSGGPLRFRRYRALLAVIERAVEASRHFDPAPALEFRAEFDRISSPELLAALASAPTEALRRVATVSFLAAIRMLAVCDLVEATLAPEEGDAVRGLALATLVHADARSLSDYILDVAEDHVREGLDRDILMIPAAAMPEREERVRETVVRASRLLGVLRAWGRSLAIEVRAAFRDRAPSFTDAVEGGGDPDRLREAIAAARAAIRSGLVRMVTALRGPVDPARLFGGDTWARTEAAALLRRDAWMYGRVLQAFVLRARAGLGLQGGYLAPRNLDAVRDLARHHATLGVPVLLSARDSDAAGLGALLRIGARTDWLDDARLTRIADAAERLAKSLEGTVEALSADPELVDLPLDRAAAARALVQYLERPGGR